MEQIKVEISPNVTTSFRGKVTTWFRDKLTIVFRGKLTTKIELRKVLRSVDQLVDW